MPEPFDLREPARRDLEDYVARDLAWQHGIGRDLYPALTRDARERFERYAAAAVCGVLDWVCTHAPDAVAPLRASGLLIWSHADNFGPDQDRRSQEGSTQ